MRKNLTTSFFCHAVTQPEALALWVDGTSVSYRELAAAAKSVAVTLRKAGLSADQGSRLALVASGTLSAYAGLLGAAMLGVTYVPISPWFPKAYILSLLSRVEADAILLDSNGAKALHGEPLDIFVADLSGGVAVHPVQTLTPLELTADTLVHIMFTSGSSGEPKMVGQNLTNIDAYLTAAQQRYAFTTRDRVSHFNELGWDPYLLDLFGAWDVGASVYAVPKRERIAPAGFIARHRLTTWFSVPSVVMLMDRLGSLKPDVFDSLRLTLFVGEPLSTETVNTWKRAAPCSQIENVYGPTECTVVCTGHPIHADTKTTLDRDYLPLGTPYEGTLMAVIDEDGFFLSAGEVGELVIGGAQVAPGYLGDPDKTTASFVTLGHPSQGRSTWYKTGDLGMRDAGGVYHFMGRADNQVKVMGNRVELEAVEAALRLATGSDEVVVITAPAVDGVIRSLVALIPESAPSSEVLKKTLGEILPRYMVPKEYRRIGSLPRNVNGKLDRNRAKNLFDDGGLG